MPGKTQIAFLKSLHQKKYRKEHNLFIAEGMKVVSELLHSSFEVKQLYFTNAFSENHPEYFTRLKKETECIPITSRELNQISAFSTPQEVFAVAAIPAHHFDLRLAESELIFLLEDISDPGNLGTIIRTADWFGIGHIVCSESCVDAYNPKVVQASMGSLFRVKVYYDDLKSLLIKNREGAKSEVYGTVLNGINIYKTELKKNGFILLGNETRGVEPSLLELITTPLTIPRSSPDRKTPDSLNVAISAALVCSEFRREKML